jgi:phosphatidate cytidylyltransferase
VAAEKGLTARVGADLKVRTLSAIVMVAVAGLALALGGLIWQLFVLAVAVGVLWEWNKLVRRIATSRFGRLVWLVAGVVYVGTASEVLASIPVMFGALGPLIPVVLVIATDVGAYFSGRTLAGPGSRPRSAPPRHGLVWRARRCCRRWPRWGCCCWRPGVFSSMRRRFWLSSPWLVLLWR